MLNLSSLELKSSTQVHKYGYWIKMFRKLRKRYGKEFRNCVLGSSGSFGAMLHQLWSCFCTTTRVIPTNRLELVLIIYKYLNFSFAFFYNLYICYLIKNSLILAWNIQNINSRKMLKIKPRVLNIIFGSVLVWFLFFFGYIYI